MGVNQSPRREAQPPAGGQDGKADGFGLMAIRIKDWAKFQHFKDRRPPWIKLYRNLLDDIQWHELEPAAAKFLVMLWLLASEDLGVLPDTKTLAFRLRISEKLVDSTISKLGHWLDNDDITVISERYQDVNVSDHQERETEKETERKQRQSAAKKPLPVDWIPSLETVTKLSRELGLRVPEDVERYVAAFRDACNAKGYTYANFDAAFCNCVRQDWPRFRNGADRLSSRSDGLALN